jgi:hypothetical protein
LARTGGAAGVPLIDEPLEVLAHDAYPAADADGGQGPGLNTMLAQ